MVKIITHSELKKLVYDAVLHSKLDSSRDQPFTNRERELLAKILTNILFNFQQQLYKKLADSGYIKF